MERRLSAEQGQLTTVAVTGVLAPVVVTMVAVAVVDGMAEEEERKEAPASITEAPAARPLSPA